MRRANAFAARLKMRYREEICYEFLMWRVLTLETISFHRDTSDVPSAFDFEGEDSVALFIEELAMEYHEEVIKKTTQTRSR
jgi:hypothetical protein